MRCAMEHRQECGFTPPKIDMDNRFIRLVATERGLLSSTTISSSSSSSSSNYRTWDNDTSNTLNTPHTSSSPHRTWDDTPNDIRSRSNSIPQYIERREYNNTTLHRIKQTDTKQEKIQPIKWDRNNSNSRLRSNTIATSSLLKSSNNNTATKNKEEFPALVSKSAPSTPQAIKPKSIPSHVPSLASDTPIITEQYDTPIIIDKKPIMTTLITFSKGKAITHVFDLTSPTSSQQLESISIKNIANTYTPKKSPYSNWTDMFKDKSRVNSVAEEDEYIERFDGLEGYHLDSNWSQNFTEENLNSS
jgi:hypothetical protein